MNSRTASRHAQVQTLFKSLEKRDSGRNQKKLKLLYSFKADRQTSHKSKLIRKYHGEGKHDHYWLPPSRTNLRHQFFIFSFFQIRSQCFHRPLLTHCGAEMLVSAQSCSLFLQDQATVLSVVSGREQGALVCSSKAAPLFFYP